MTSTPRKRPRAFGKVEQLKSGNYRAGYPDPRSAARPKPYIWAPHTFAKKAPADAWLAKTKADIDAGSWLHPDDETARDAAAAAEAERKRITLGEYAATWIKTRRNSKGMPLSPNTVRERERMLRPAAEKAPDHPGGPLAELVPLMLADITADRVREWYATQQERGTLTQTSRAYELLKAIMTTALEDELIDKQPCTIKGGSTASTGIEHAPPSNEDQFVKLLDATPKRYKALVVVAAASGCRYGEAVDLRADDITVHLDEAGAVEHVIVRIDSQAGRDASEAASGAKPKSGKGDVLVYGEDADIIAQHAEGLSGRALLFPAVTSDAPLPPSTFWRHFDKARIAAGLPKTRFHDLRHYAGTRYAQTGATIKEIQDRLRHKTASAAMRYQHAGDEARLAQLAAAAARPRRAAASS